MADREAWVEALLDTLYRVASDPDMWEELIDALPESALDGQGLAGDLRRGVEIAERTAPRDTGGPPRPRARVRLDAKLTVRAANDGAVALCGLDPTGRPLPLADDDSEHAVRQALARLARSEAAVVMFRLRGVEGPLVGRLTSDPSGASLSFGPTAIDEAAIRSLGLTPAEARLVAALGDADGLKDAARRIGVSVNTARNQLASVFEKLGVRRQADLARLVTEVAALERPATVDEDPWPRRRAITLRDGRRLAYRVYGDEHGARTVLTFHDGLGSSLLPLETGPAAHRLGLRVIAAERPGYGGSAPLRPYSLEAVAEDMEQLCAATGAETPILVSLLSGAAPMLATAARLGSRASRIVILSGRPPREPTDAGANPLLRFRASMVRHPRLTQAAFAILRTRMSPQAAKRMLDRAGRSSPGDRAFLAANPETPAFLSRATSEALESAGAGPAAELALAGADPTFHLADVTAPLSVFHGAEDRLSPLEDLRAYLGNRPYELTVFPDIGQLMAFRHWTGILAEL
ncbi:MAG: alpha/beta fold hydrolase [Pseudomonadota bacterium]